jgi:mannosyltransferase
MPAVAPKDAPVAAPDSVREAPLLAVRPADEGESTPWIWMIALMVAATVLRVIALDQQLWYDEIVTVVNSVRKPLATILTTYTTQNQHTFYSILARLSVVAFGEQRWALRLPAVWFGIASVPALYFFGRLVASRREALLASAVMVFSYHHVWFSQNARGYTAMLFFTLLTSYLFVRGAQRDTWGIWVSYAVAMALGLYTHLTMGFVAAGHGVVYLWLVAERYRRAARFPKSAVRPLVGFLLAGLLAGICYLPMGTQLVSRSVGQAGPSVHWEWKNPLWLVLETLRGLKVGAGGSSVALALAGLMALTGLVSYWRRNRYVVALMLLPCFITGAVMLVLEHNLWPRFFFFALGFAFLLLLRGGMAWAEAAALRLGRESRAGLLWGTALGILMVVASAATLPPAYRYPKQDFVGAMRLVDTERRADEPVVTVGLTSFAYRQYFGRDWREIETPGDLDALRAQGHRVWMVYAFPIYLQGRYPEIWKEIQSEFVTVHVFRGTLVDGEIYVCQAGAGTPAPQAAR